MSFFCNRVEMSRTIEHGNQKSVIIKSSTPSPRKKLEGPEDSIQIYTQSITGIA